jgi:hypothetical protein
MREIIPVFGRRGLLVRKLPDPPEGFPEDHKGLQRLPMPGLPERIYIRVICHPYRKHFMETEPVLVKKSFSDGRKYLILNTHNTPGII